MANLRLDATEISFLFACYYYANALFVFWAGIILDRYSPKKILIIAYIIACIGVLVFAFTNSLAYMAVSRLVLGVAGSFSMLICFRYIKRCLPASKTAFVTGLVTTYAACGVLFSQTPFVIAISKFGWRASLLINFWLGVLFCVLTISLAQDLPPNIQEAPNRQTTIWDAIKISIKNLQNWFIGFSASFFSLLGLFFNLSWGIVYLQQTKGFSVIDSSYIISLINVGGIIGASLMGWLADRFHVRKLVLILGNAFTLDSTRLAA